MDNKVCNICKQEKPLDEFYSQQRQSKSKGSYIYVYPYCKECSKDKSSKWVKENPEHYNETRYKYRRTEKYREYEREKNNREYYKKYKKEWRVNNADKMNMFGQLRRSKMKQLKCELSLEDWNKILEKFNYSCTYCGKTEDDCIEEYGQRLHQEHIVPMNKNGSYTKNNIVPACKGYNCSKHDRDFIEWYREQEFYDIQKETKVLEHLNNSESEVA